MDAMGLVDAARMSVGGLIAAFGLLMMLGGVLGVLRFPDLYTRLHAVTTSDGLGASIFCVGLAVIAPDGAMAVRLLLLAALLMAIGPVLTHLSASAAHAGGLAPIAGRYTAPRPGAAPRKDAAS